jgi:L-ascorbate metabolism protein UlaG (beta-lactamase superfamily)
MKISMIGHSSVLIETEGLRILTDPFFGLRGNLIYSRPKPPSCKREDVADVDLVLVSHNHFDHTDRAFFRSLPPSTPVIAPSKTSWVTRIKGGRNVIGIAPWQQKTFGEVILTAVPAWHSTITHGFVIEAQGKRIYFAADTYYARFMQRIAREFKPDIVLMPVTTYRVPLTMGEKGALATTRILSPKVIIPIHLGIEPRSPLMRNSQTPKRFEERLQKEGITTKVALLREGESWSDSP